MIIKDHTTPQMRRYTTAWNIGLEKLNLYNKQHANNKTYIDFLS